MNLRDPGNRAAFGRERESPFSRSDFSLVAYRYITQANDLRLGREKICLILTRGHGSAGNESRAGDDVAASNLNSREFYGPVENPPGKIDREYLHIDKMP